MPRSKQSGSDFIDALPDDGERRLMLAVLIDAIRLISHDFDAVPAAERYAWQRDRAWMQRDDPNTPFSFVSICNALNLNAGYVRRWVRKLESANAGLRLHRYAAKVEESWERQRRPAGSTRPPRRRTKAPRPGGFSNANRISISAAGGLRLM